MASLLIRFLSRSLDFFLANTAGGGIGALGINWLGKDLGPFKSPSRSLERLNFDLSRLETVARNGFLDFLGLCLSKFSLNKWFTAETPLYPRGFCTLDFLRGCSLGTVVGTVEVW